jgi:hypothetical protein
MRVTPRKNAAVFGSSPWTRGGRRGGLSVLALASALWLAAPALGASTWTGTWNTDYGTMRLTQRGGSVTGTYDWPVRPGKLAGTASGSVLTGTWTEDPPSTGTGPFEFVMSSDGLRFTGTWSDVVGGGGGTWSGTRTTFAPQLGKSVVASTVRGVIRIRRPGSRSFAELAGDASVPVGSTVDSRRGSLRISAAANRTGDSHSGVFRDGIFKVLQKAGAKPVTELRLTGRLERCGKPGRASAAKVKGRRLWGRAKGRFRTRGRRSAATVTGTDWLVADRCDGSTLTRVRSGSVSVRDLRRRVTVELRRGQRYVAR